MFLPHDSFKLFGSLLALTSVAWELFFTAQSESIKEAIKWRILNDKLDRIFYRQYEFQRHFDFKINTINDSVKAHGCPLDSVYHNDSMHLQDLDFNDKQADLFKKIKLGMFIVGSICILLGQSIEYSAQYKEKKSKTSPVVPAPFKATDDLHKSNIPQQPMNKPSLNKKDAPDQKAVR